MIGPPGAVKLMVAIPQKIGTDDANTFPAAKSQRSAARQRSVRGSFRNCRLC